jgi:SAM-dependent methyltransferase
MASGRIGRAVKRLREWGVARMIACRAYDWLCERRFGIRTGGVRSLAALGVGNAACHDYGPTTYLEFRHAMRHVTVRPDRDVFLELGCGMGRIVVMAARYPFRKVIGLELVPELLEAARQNVERARRHLVCDDVELVSGNAADYAIPADVSVIFLFNPFSGPVLVQVFNRIRQSAIESPRPISIIYINTGDFEKQLGGFDWLVKRCDCAYIARGAPSAIYDVRLPAAPVSKSPGRG